MNRDEHHASCRESDKGLVWHCHQCGLNESAEDIEDANILLMQERDKLQEQLAAEREKSEAWRVEAVDERVVSKQLRDELAAERRTAFQAQEMAKEINGKLDIAIKAFKEIATEDVMNEASYVVGVAAAALKKI